MNELSDTNKEQLHYLSSFHDLLCFCIEVEISPQGFEQHLFFDTHSLAVDVSKLLDATKHIKFSSSIFFSDFHALPFHYHLYKVNHAPVCTVLL